MTNTISSSLRENRELSNLHIYLQKDDQFYEPTAVHSIRESISHLSNSQPRKTSSNQVFSLRLIMNFLNFTISILLLFFVKLSAGKSVTGTLKIEKTFGWLHL